MFAVANIAPEMPARLASALHRRHANSADPSGHGDARLGVALARLPSAPSGNRCLPDIYPQAAKASGMSRPGEYFAVKKSRNSRCIVRVFESEGEADLAITEESPFDRDRCDPGS